jgi:transposase
MGLIHSNDCHCHCCDGLPCIPDTPALPDVPYAVPEWLPSFDDIKDATVECGPLQPAFDRAIRHHRKDESLDLFEQFEDVCSVTMRPEDEEGSMGPYWKD